jgi:uncharacterized protein (TIGR03086 family)
MDRDHQTTTAAGPLGRAFVSTRAVLATVRAGQLHLATPCASWDVRALIDHFIGTPRWWASIVGKEGAASPAGDAGRDFLDRYDESIDIALAAFGSDGVLDLRVPLPFGEFSGAEILGMAAAEQFTHGWDLARAIGYPTDLDGFIAEDLLVRSKEVITDAIRGPDGVALFGPVVEAPAGACPADRLAAFLGRPR